MPSFNQVILMGHMTRDPQLKFLSNQTPVAEFGVACNRKYKTSGGEEREEVLFADCAAFGKTGELINEYFTKGKPIFVVGRLKYDSWDDKNGGGKRSKISVVVDNFQFVGGRDGEAEQGGNATERALNTPPRQPSGDGKHADMFRKPAGVGAASQRPEPPFGAEKQFEEADIPF